MDWLQDVLQDDDISRKSHTPQINKHRVLC